MVFLNRSTVNTITVWISLHYFLNNAIISVAFGEQ